MNPPLNNLIVSPIRNDKNKVKSPSTSAVPKKPPKNKFSEFPHTGLYVHIKGKDRKSEIKAKLETISLRKLKARLKDVNELWCESNRDPKYADLSKMLQLENDWLREVIQEASDKIRFAQLDAEQARLDAETPEERAEREAKREASKARSRAGLKKMRKWESIGRLVTRFVEEADREGVPVTEEEVWEYKKNLIKVWDDDPPPP